MTVGEDESVSVEPLGVLGREVHVSGPEDVSGRGHALGSALSTAVRDSGNSPWAHPGVPSWPRGQHGSSHAMQGRTLATTSAARVRMVLGISTQSRTFHGKEEEEEPT